MLNSPSWFDENEYSNFLTESMILFEMNIPLQKEKIESRKKLREFDRQSALRRINLRRQNMRDEGMAKARGIQMGLGEGFIKQTLMNNFLQKIEEGKNPIKTEKRKMRPEVDPADRERDRKREDRRESQQQSELKKVIVVKNNKRNKIEIIPKDDYDPNYHTVLKGRVKKIDKGNVTPRDLTHYSKMDNFINTKTSVRLIGKVEKTKQKETKKIKKQKSKVEKLNMNKNSTPIPQPPRPRTPKDGKEITDPASTYPDWDHNTNQMIAVLPFAFNSTSSGKQMPQQFNELLTTSRTLGKSIERFVQEITNEYPQITNLNLSPANASEKTSKFWSKQGMKEGQSNAFIVGTPKNKISGAQKQIGFALKIGEQIRPGLKGEANFVLFSILNLIPQEQIIPVFSLFVDDFIQNLRTTYSRVMSPPSENMDNQGTAILIKQRWQKEAIKIQKEKLINAAKNLIERFINENETIKSAFINECLTGMIKFNGGPGSAQMLLCGKKDGSDTAITEINEAFIDKLVQSQDTYLNLKFSPNKPSQGGMLEFLLNKINTTFTTSGMDIVGEIQKIKQQITNPLAFLQVFELVLEDVTYKVPILYSEFVDQMNADTNNIITLNYGTDKQQEIEIPVKINYNPEGTPESVIEKGLDNILQEYFYINDILTEQVNTGNLNVTESLAILEEVFDLVEKRNYRQEYDNYHSKSTQRANRSKRVLARRKMEEKGRVHKGDGKDVDHKNGNPQDNSDNNLRVLPKSKNRSMNEDHGAGFEGTDTLVNNLINQTPFATNPIKVGLSKYIEDRYVKKLKKK